MDKSVMAGIYIFGHCLFNLMMMFQLLLSRKYVLSSFGFGKYLSYGLMVDVSGQMISSQRRIDVQPSQGKILCRHLITKSRRVIAGNVCNSNTLIKLFI
jgi:hypothetical protein